MVLMFKLLILSIILNVFCYVFIDIFGEGSKCGKFIQFAYMWAKFNAAYTFFILTIYTIYALFFWKI